MTKPLGQIERYTREAARDNKRRTKNYQKDLRMEVAHRRRRWAREDRSIIQERRQRDATARRRRSPSKAADGLLSSLLWAGGVFGYIIWSGNADVRRVVRPELLALLTLGLIVMTLLISMSNHRKAAARRARVQALEQLRIASLDMLSMTPLEFEQEVARVLAVRFSYEARVVGGAGDGGIDVELLADGKVKGIAQCKHRSDPTSIVPPGVLRELDSVKLRTGVPLTILATNARFSSASYDQAKTWGIELLDGIKLQEMREMVQLPLVNEAGQVATAAV